MENTQFEVLKPVHGQRATVVEVVAYLDTGEKIVVKGEALRHPTDRHDEELANLLATGRALELMGRKLTKRAEGLVRHNDHLAAQRQKQKSGKTKRGLLRRSTKA